MSGVLANSEKTILIASSSIDEPSWRPVANILDKRGLNVVEYEADKVADGTIPLDIHVNNKSGLSIKYGDKRLWLESIVAAWYRRPTQFSEEKEDKARQYSLDFERNAIQHAMWNAIPENRWLSSPQVIQRAERKLTQLILAKELGFEIPNTVITNSWKSMHDTLPEKIVFKPSYGMFYDRTGMKILYVSPLENKLKSLPTKGLPFPGFWQPYLAKAREWRITVVGDHSFDAAIYTDESAKDDWRRHQLSGDHVVFKSETFPDIQKKLCFEYLSKLGLKFGAFDFIEDADGKITFLECNANGQYGWLEDDLGFPIAQAIADELVAISKGH